MKTKLYILTGFLGSGKTTLLLTILRNLRGRKVGVIQNETGKVSIDGAILRSGDIQMTEITRGSIFCACRKSSFIESLREMAARDFEYLFVESSGIADPSNVGEILTALGDGFEYRGLICLVDAVNFAWQLAGREEALRQVKHCNMAVITKRDLLTKYNLTEAETAIRGINPVCPIRYSTNGDLPLDFLEEDLLQYRFCGDEETTNSADTKPKTIFINITEPVDRAELTAFLREISPKVLRIKGFAEVAGEGLCQVDGVGKVTAVRPTTLDAPAQLVFISAEGNKVIRDVFEAWKNMVSAKMEIRN